MSPYYMYIFENMFKENKCCRQSRHSQVQGHQENMAHGHGFLKNFESQPS